VRRDARGWALARRPRNALRDSPFELPDRARLAAGFRSSPIRLDQSFRATREVLVRPVSPQRIPRAGRAPPPLARRLLTRSEHRRHVRRRSPTRTHSYRAPVQSPPRAKRSGPALSPVIVRWRPRSRPRYTRSLGPRRRINRWPTNRTAVTTSMLIWARRPGRAGSSCRKQSRSPSPRAAIGPGRGKGLGGPGSGRPSALGPIVSSPCRCQRPVYQSDRAGD
jgi:hypothetical protein